LNIQEDGQAEFGPLLIPQPVRYIVAGSQIYVLDKYAEYSSLEIKNDKTFQLHVPELKEIFVLKWISDEELQAIKTNYENEKGLQYLMEFYQMYGRFDKLVEVALEIIKENPENEEVYNTLANAYNELGEHEKAIDILNQLLQINPQNVSDLGNLSYYYLFVRDYKSAEQSALKALAIDPTQLWIKANLGTALLFQDEYEQAERIFLELGKKMCFSYRTCAEAWLGDFDELEAAGVIPESQKENVEKLREILEELYMEWHMSDWYGEDENTPTLTEEQQEGIIEVVKIWINELFTAEDVHRLMQLSDVPFAYDRERIITTSDDLKKLYLEIFEEKGPRTIPVHEVEILDYTSEVLWGYIPLNFVKVKIIIDQEPKFRVCVLIRDNTFKIVGINYIEEWEYATEVIDWDDWAEVEVIPEEEDPGFITVLNGTIQLQIWENYSSNFWIQLTDFSLDRQENTSFRIKKQGAYYIIDGVKYSTVNQAVTGYMKNFFKDYYDGIPKGKKRGKKAWAAFIKEGGLQKLINFVKE